VKVVGFYCFYFLMQVPLQCCWCAAVPTHWKGIWGWVIYQQRSLLF